MAEQTKPNPTVTQPAPSPVPAATILILIARDYWPKTRPADMPEDVEHRVRAGESVALPAEEAMDVVEAGIGTRVRREDILKG